MVHERHGAALFLLAGYWLISGCESTGAPHRYQNDPLVLTKKPVPGKIDSAVPVLVASAEPAAPPIPQMFLASLAKPTEKGAAGTVSAKISVTDQALTPSPAQESRVSPHADLPLRGGREPKLVSRETAPGAYLPAHLAVRTRAEGTYGHAADYTWLEGVLERNRTGNLDLRYCELSQEDRWEGKVSLLDDSRLKQFKEGDIIRVEGEVIAHANAGAAPTPFASYRIREIVAISSR